MPSRTATDTRTADPVETIVEQWADVLPDLDTTPLRVLGRMQRLVHVTDTLLRRPFAQEGLAAGDFDVLAALRRADAPLAMGRLAEAMLVTAGATTKRVDRLEAAGLVARARAGGDRRERFVELSDNGRDLTDRLVRRHLANEAAVLAPLTADEQEQLAALLARILRAVDVKHVPAQRD